jgi:VWFA-related protein
MSTPVRRRAAAVALALAAAFGCAAAQNPPPPPEPVQEPLPPPTRDDDQVQLGTELVNVPFNVADKKNKPIVDLKQEDVQVFEDGKPQKVFSFERQFDTALTIALLVDISGSQELTIGVEREAASRFFQKVLRPDKDLAGVITFAKEVVLEQTLTSSLSSLNQALNRARVSPSSGLGRGGTAPTNPMAGGTSMFDAVYLASEDVLRREAGRRVVILLTDGEDTTSVYNSAAAIERAWRAEVIIYAIGIGDRNYNPVATGPLDKLAKETGGRIFVPDNLNELDRAFAEIENDLRQQYVISYEPSNTALDGTFRKIEVRVVPNENRKDLRVRHRRGYYAPKA